MQQMLPPEEIKDLIRQDVPSSIQNKLNLRSNVWDLRSPAGKNRTLIFYYRVFKCCDIVD